MKRISALCLSLLLIIVSNNALAGGGRYHHSFGHHGGHGNFVGGLLIGGVLSHAFAPRHYRTVVVERSRPMRTSYPAADHWLLLDLSGHCYSVDRKSDGTEVRREVEVEQCED